MINLKEFNENMKNYPIITDPFTIATKGTFRFVKYGPVTYWNCIEQQGVEQLINGNWEKLSYDGVQE